MMKKPDKTAENNPFRVPEGYFEEVNKKIISATSGKSYGERSSVSPVKFRTYLLAAASIAGFMILSYTAVRVIAPHALNMHESELIPEDYFSPYLNDLDIYSLEENAASLAIPDQGPDVSKADIIEYLVLENIEISDIYEQL
jgi:hypothetical protein